MTIRPAAAGIALTVALVGSAAVVVTGCSNGHKTASRADPAAVSAPTAAPTSAVTAPSTTASSLPPSTAASGAGGWQPVAQAAGLDQLVTPRGAVIRMDPSRLELALVPGTAEPGGAFPEGGQVPADRRASLVAATNAGFKRHDARGGEMVDGQTVGSLVTGAASLVVHADGTVDVGAWGVSVGPRSDNVVVLQNLTLLVDGGQPAADLGRDILGRWGVTFRPALPVSVWRSGVGVDGQGRLLFAAGPNLVPAELAQLLVAAGAVRAMQLDINHMWVFVAFFAHPDPQQPGVVQGRPMLAGMTPKPEHVLVPGERDFLAIYQRS